MKKTLVTMMACVALGATCGAEENTEKGFGLEVNAAYNFALKDIASDVGFKVDTYGLDLTAVYRIDKHNSVNLHFGWATGDNDKTYIDETGETYSGNLKAEITNITIMPGYRYTTAVTDATDFFWGVNAGLVRTEAEVTGLVYGYEYGSASWKEDEWNFAWSTEVGIAQKVSAHSRLTLALQLQGLYAQPYFKDLEGEPSSQLQLGVRAGYSCQF